MATLQNLYAFQITANLNQVTDSELLLRIIGAWTSTGSSYCDFGKHCRVESPAVATGI
jgi:hypothetical protein